MALVTILAREMRLKVFSNISGAKLPILNVTSRARKISLKFVEKMSIFNRIYRANIVTSGPSSTSKACLTFNRISRANFVICGTRTTQSQRIACFNRIPRTKIVTKASLLAIAWKARLSLHCDGIQGKRSSTSCG